MSEKSAKPRLLQDGRDMFWSMAPLVLGCIVLAGLLGMCSFAPSGPGKAPAPPYDAAAALQADANSLQIPIRNPQVPSGWHANSGARGGIDAGRVDAQGRPARAVYSRVGYLTAAGLYISLTQSDADEQKLVASFDPNLVPTGVVDVDGKRWISYDGAADARPVWTTGLPGPGGNVQVAISGAAGPADFRTLAAAVQTQLPLRRN